MRGEGRELEKKSMESNATEKGTQRARTWERERERETVGNFAYLLYPKVSAFNPWTMQEGKS